MPFSKHSIAQPTSQPTSLTSMPIRSVMLASLKATLWSVIPICGPIAEKPSYSGSSPT
jgi:hypothetical protein